MADLVDRIRACCYLQDCNGCGCSENCGVLAEFTGPITGCEQWRQEELGLSTVSTGADNVSRETTRVSAWRETP